MKTALKILITVVVGFGAGWVCLNVLNLDSALGPLVGALIGGATYSICDKVMDKKENPKA